MTMRSGRLKSPIAAPSRRNSGLEATAKRAVVADFGEDALDFVAGADRHGRLGDDDRRMGEVRADFGCHGMDEGKVGMAVAAPRGRPHGNEDGAGPGDPFGEIGGELKAARCGVAAHQFLKPGLVNRHLARVEPVDLGRVLVDAHDIVAEIGKAGTRNQPDIARAHHCNFHALPLHGSPNSKLATSSSSSVVSSQRAWPSSASAVKRPLA